MASDERKATGADADIVMKLYDLRRESEMRKARNWFATWNLDHFDQLIKVAQSFTAPENAWFRQVTSYWENAASLVLRGAVHKELFLDWNHEIIFVYAKLKPYLGQMREFWKSPQIMANTETLLEGTPELRQEVTDMIERLKKFREMQQSKAAA